MSTHLSFKFPRTCPLSVMGGILTGIDTSISIQEMMSRIGKEFGHYFQIEECR